MPLELSCGMFVFQIQECFTFKNHFYGAKTFHPKCLNEHKKCSFSQIYKNSFITDLECFYSRSETTEENLNDSSQTLQF